MEACRLAESSDLPRIVELARALRSEIALIRGGPLWSVREGHPEPLEHSYAVLLERQDTCVVVGTIDAVVIGFGVGELDSLHDGRTLGVISDLFVEPEARGIGVGEEMVTRMTDFFAAQGCIGIDAWALPGHRMTKNFFEGHGFVSRGIVVHRPLMGGGEP